MSCDFLQIAGPALADFLGSQKMENSHSFRSRLADHVVLVVFGYRMAWGPERVIDTLRETIIGKICDSTSGRLLVGQELSGKVVADFRIRRIVVGDVSDLAFYVRLSDQNNDCMVDKIEVFDMAPFAPGGSCFGVM